MSFFKGMLGRLTLYDEECDSEVDVTSEGKEKKKTEKKKTDKIRIIPHRKSHSSKVDEDLIKLDIPYPLLNQINKRKQMGFSETLLGYCDQSLMKDSEIYKRAGIDRKHFSKIRSNINYNPTKSTVFALIIALELPLEDAKKLLVSAGYSLSNSFETDIIISYYLERGVYDMTIINDKLFRRRLNTI